jgi:hypothetical protein
MAERTFPRSDAEFKLAAEQYVGFLAGAPVGLASLNAARVAQMEAALTAFSAALTNQKDAEAAKLAATQTKRDARNTLEDLMEADAAFHKSNPDIKPEELAGMGLPMKDKEPTPVQPPTTRPVLEVDTSERFLHEVEFYDETAAGGSKAKPAGVQSCEIRFAIAAAPPADPSGYTYHSDDSRTPCEVEFTAAEVGKTAHYIARWKTRTGETGPWSQTVSATITG